MRPLWSGYWQVSVLPSISGKPGQRARSFEGRTSQRTSFVTCAALESLESNDFNLINCEKLERNLRERVERGKQKFDRNLREIGEKFESERFKGQKKIERN